jgi:hypothetical protein
MAERTGIEWRDATRLEPGCFRERVPSGHLEGNLVFCLCLGFLSFPRVLALLGLPSCLFFTRDVPPVESRVLAVFDDDSALAKDARRDSSFRIGQLPPQDTVDVFDGRRWSAEGTSQR